MEKEYGTIFLYKEKRRDGYEINRSMFRVPAKIRTLIEKDADWAHKSRHLTVYDAEIGAMLVFKTEGAYLNYTTLKSQRKDASITKNQYAQLIRRLNELEKRGGKREG